MIDMKRNTKYKKKKVQYEQKRYTKIKSNTTPK